MYHIFHSAEVTAQKIPSIQYWDQEMCNVLSVNEDELDQEQSKHGSRLEDPRIFQPLNQRQEWKMRRRCPKELRAGVLVKPVESAGINSPNDRVPGS